MQQDNAEIYSELDQLPTITTPCNGLKRLNLDSMLLDNDRHIESLQAPLVIPCVQGIELTIMRQEQWAANTDQQVTQGGPHTVVLALP